MLVASLSTIDNPVIAYMLAGGRSKPNPDGLEVFQLVAHLFYQTMRWMWQNILPIWV